MDKARGDGHRLLLDRGHLDTRGKHFFAVLILFAPLWRRRPSYPFQGNRGVSQLVALPGTEGHKLALPSGPLGAKPSLIISNQVKNS